MDPEQQDGIIDIRPGDWVDTSWGSAVVITVDSHSGHIHYRYEATKPTGETIWVLNGDNINDVTKENDADIIGRRILDMNSLEPYLYTNNCSICGLPCLVENMHTHPMGRIGECCWDERLRVTM